MKNCLMTILLLSSFVVFSQSELESVEGKGHHCKFEEKTLTIGAGIPYSFDLELAGFNSRVYYNVGEFICFGPEFSFFEKEDESVYDFNLVGHYIFETRWAGVYPLVGVNYTIEKVHGYSEKEFGLVAGVGAHRNFNKVTLFTEYAHVQSALPDNIITIGLMFTFK